MPLKHFTETFLIVLLGAIIALTGLLTASLPPLPEGALPWAILFVLSLVYPISLNGLFQRRRADTFFRKLHWIPAGMLLLWLVLEIGVYNNWLSSTAPWLATWGWMLGLVTVAFFFIITFVLKVIRRWVPRLAFLALIFVPFAAAALFSELTETHMERELTAALWSHDFWETGVDTEWIASLTGTGSDQKNLEPSEDQDEEEWRERLRMQERRQERILARLEDRSSSSTTTSSSSSTPPPPPEEPEDPKHEYNGTDTKPEKLPDSGLGWHAIILTMAALYCGVLHNRARSLV